MVKLKTISLSFVLISLMGAAALALSGCAQTAKSGSAGSGATSSPAVSPGASGPGGPEAIPDVPGARTVVIRALDDLSFVPKELTATVGERIHFVVYNEGRLPHEFLLGDTQTQNEHETAMATPSSSADGHDHGAMSMTSSQMPMKAPIAMLSLQAGETKDVTVPIESPGTLLYGCHVPGHYGGGMVGTLTVT